MYCASERVSNPRVYRRGRIHPLGRIGRGEDTANVGTGEQEGGVPDKSVMSDWDGDGDSDDDEETRVEMATSWLTCAWAQGMRTDG
jgi:hypothetical protein